MKHGGTIWALIVSLTLELFALSIACCLSIKAELAPKCFDFVAADTKLAHNFAAAETYIHLLVLELTSAATHVMNVRSLKCRTDVAKMTHMNWLLLGLARIQRLWQVHYVELMWHIGIQNSAGLLHLY